MTTPGPLLSPIKIGDLSLKNRAIMAALTRQRADPKTGVPNDLHVEYYSQRAGAGLILSECSQVSAESQSFPGSAGIHSEEQVAGWKRVTDAVHKAGSLMFLQIWHGGRTVPKEYSGVDPIAPSVIKNRDTYHSIGSGKRESYTTPRAMTKEEIKSMVQTFRKGAENAKRAGFDGIELHGANGYLIDEFLQSTTNQRTDEYGGSAENRSRFPLEVIDQLIAVFGKSRVGIKISPVSRYNDMCDANPIETYGYFLTQLSQRGIAFVEGVEAVDMNSNGHPAPKSQLPEVAKTLRPYFKGTWVANNGFNYQTGNKIITDGNADAVSFGSLWLANPDLLDRFEFGWSTNQMSWETAFGGNGKGYTDYPVYTGEGVHLKKERDAKKAAKQAECCVLI